MRLLFILTTLVAMLTTSGCNKSLSSGGYGLAALAIGYWVVDPRAPTWNVHMDVMDNNQYTILLKTKTFTNGGEGEARVIFRNAAQQLVTQEKALNYEIVSYEEGLENEFLGGRRYARGVIRLHKQPDDGVGWYDARR